MSELERALQLLVEYPDRLPDPLDELERRVAVRRRQRSRRRAAVAVVVLVLLGSFPVLAGWRDRDTVVHTGPVDRPPGLPGNPGPQPPRVRAEVPDGWLTLLADGDRLVVATRRLDDRDVALAVLARDDVTFAAFPADGMVLVVGGDRLTPKYTFSEVGRVVVSGTEQVQIGGTPAAPGPANGLGEEKMLPGGVRVRRGDVPQSTVLLAAYAGPAAAPEAILQAEAIAASVRLAPATEPGAPPPSGSRPGFDAGEPPDERLRTSATARVGTLLVSLDVGDGCAVVRMASGQRIAGRCQAERADAGSVAVVITSLMPNLPPPPGVGPPTSQMSTNQVLIVVARASPEIRTVKAVLVDGRKVQAPVDADGWALVGTDSRAYLLEGYEAQGRLVAHTPVT